MRLSKLAEGIKTSPILTLAAEINDKIAAGEQFYNLTVGDFNPDIFPIPEAYREGIINAYKDGETNYPGAKGLLGLRQAVSAYLNHYGQLDYAPDNILITGGARPIIYAIYKALIDPGDKVIFPVPSWNNDHYSHLNSAQQLLFETHPEDNFMPRIGEIRKRLDGARLLALCSPLNPTGTALSRQGLEDICDMVLEENARRAGKEKPLYVLFDQIYWMLTFGDTVHYNAVQIRPEMREYAIFIDGISKAFAATGVRLGWGFGPADVLAKMRSVVAHMGAWAPRAEQAAAAKFLMRTDLVDDYMANIRKQIQNRLDGFYKRFKALEESGHQVTAIAPQAAMYLTVQFDLAGKATADGRKLNNSADVHRYILDEAKVGLVPFSYFGASEDSTWYRLSVGTCHIDQINDIMDNIEAALKKLS